MHRVLKPFDLSRDGVTSEPVAVGDEVEIPEGLVPGLIAEGYITEPQAKPEKPKPAPKGEAKPDGGGAT